MKLYELQKVTEQDYDCHDVDFDCCVTMCYINKRDITDDYDRFCVELAKKVDVIRTHGTYATCDWTSLIQHNFKKFKKFTKEEWTHDYPNLEDFICEWINELNSYVAGNMPENYYKKLYDFVSTLE